MNTVKSKYKNPDRLIENLKRTVRSDNSRLEFHFKRIGELQNQLAELNKSVLGNHWFTYSKDVTKGVSFNERSTALESKYGDKVFIEGRITKLVVSEKTGENEATFTLTNVYLKG